ncbi:hypothetical protein CF319_g2386 [Tilletia indica]|nr:hypothetical protein CF319_g2386 [Tilletia indica]
MASASYHSRDHPIVIDSDSDSEDEDRPPPCLPGTDVDTLAAEALALLNIPLSLTFSSFRSTFRSYVLPIHPDRSFGSPLAAQFTALANAAADRVSERADFEAAIQLATSERRWYNHLRKFYEKKYDCALREANRHRAAQKEDRTFAEVFRTRAEEARKRAETAGAENLRANIRRAAASAELRHGRPTSSPYSAPYHPTPDGPDIDDFHHPGPDIHTGEKAVPSPFSLTACAPASSDNFPTPASLPSTTAGPGSNDSLPPPSFPAKHPLPSPSPASSSHSSSPASSSSPANPLLPSANSPGPHTVSNQKKKVRKRAAKERKKKVLDELARLTQRRDVLLRKVSKW